jgi:di/tricarboxylate transporter
MSIFLFFLAVFIAVFVGSKFKINYGVIAFAVGLIIGTIYLGGKTNDVLAHFPLSLFFNLFVITLFYGFANETGALDGVATRIIYKFRNHGKLMPFVVFGACIIVSAMGAGAPATPVIMSGLAFSLAIKFGYHPILASLAVWMGSMIGDSVPWSSSFASNIGRYTVFFNETEVTNALVLRVIWYLVVFTALFTVIYFITKANKIETKGIEIEKPKPFTAVQRKAIIVTSVVILLIIIPAFCQMVFPNPVTKWMKSKLTIQVLCSCGAVVMGLLQLCDFGEVLKKRVPWNLIITISGMTFLMSCSNDLGVPGFFGNVLSNSVSGRMVVPAIILVTGILTYFVDGQAVTAIVLPMLPALVAASGQTVGTIILAYLFNVTASLSPFSTGGAMALSGCPDELRQKMVSIQMYLPWILLAVSILVGATGILSLGTNI